MESLGFRKPVLFLLALVVFGTGFFVLAESNNLNTPSVLDYAPNLWFDSTEQYYPVNPLDFYYENGQEIEGQIAVSKYNQMSLESKLKNITVLYQIQDYGKQWVYQYWLFYVFNKSEGFIKNQHYGDWEAIFVFVDKQTSQVNKVIGTAHQREIFDTEINNPGVNHIWSYIGNGSHAICVDNEDDGKCDFLRWRRLELWNKNGSKIYYNNYNLREINPDFIDQFNGLTTLEKSSILGIETDSLKLLGIDKVSWGGSPPPHAWAQSSFNNPEELRPISWSLITEYVSEKVEQSKNKVVGFFDSLFGSQEQQANIREVIIEESFPDENNENKQEGNQTGRGIDGGIPASSLASVVSQINQPEIIEQKIEIKSIPAEILTKAEIPTETQENQTIESSESSQILPPTPPFGLASFPGGIGPSIENEPEPEPEIVDTTPPSAIIDLSAQPGANRGQISLSWTASGADEYIIRYATSSAVTASNWASSTDFIGEPAPSLASSTEFLIISDLNPSQIYYWAIKSQDEAGNLSEISNCASSSPSGLAGDIVISELAVQGTGAANDEFIELYNPSNQTIDLSGWSIQYRGSAAGSFQKKNFVAGNSVSAQGYFLIANSSYLGHAVADMSHNSFQMSGVGGTIFLNNNQDLLASGDEDSIIDKLAYGVGAYLFPEISEFSSAPGAGQSLERKNQSTSTAALLAVNGQEHWQGNNWDSNNNSQDFVLQDDPNPQNSFSLIEPGAVLAALAEIDWPMLQGDLQHTGLSSYMGTATGTPTSTPKWMIDFGSGIFSSPIIDANGLIYFGTDDGRIHQINSNGSYNLFYDTLNSQASRTLVIASDGTIYSADKNYLYALTSDGQLKWKFLAGNYNSSPTIASDGSVYIASDYYLYALTPNGEEIWQSPLLSNGRWIKSPVVDANGVIYTIGKIGSCACCQRIYALNPQDGSVIWQTGAGPYNTGPSLDSSGIIYSGGDLNSRSGLYALNSSDGSQKWFSYLGDIRGLIPAVGQDRIYASSDNYGLAAVNKSDGSLDWYFGVGDYTYALPIIDNQGNIYLGFENKMFYALNLDGSIKWLAELDSQIRTGAVIGANGTVYIGTLNGKVYAFGD